MTCDKCGKEIRGSSITIGGGIYHIECSPDVKTTLERTSRKAAFNAELDAVKDRALTYIEQKTEHITPNEYMSCIVADARRIREELDKIEKGEKL